MTLIDIVRNLDGFEESATIYAKKPWNCDSTAIVAIEPESGGLPNEAKPLGLDYFIEIAIACDVIDNWVASLKTEPPDRERCERLIYYAINDA